MNFLKLIAVSFAAFTLSLNVQAASMVGNKAIAQLELQLVQYFSAKTLTVKNSNKLLQQNHFDYEDINWENNANVIHGPVHLSDGEEEVMSGMPYVLAFNQGKSIVGIGGYLSPALVNKLNKLPTMRCNVTKIQYLTVCYHNKSPEMTTKKFQTELIYLVEHSE